MEKKIVLDCTLRDGGYYTNWSFDDIFVKELVSCLNESRVDIIELGYKSPLKGGKYRKCNDMFIWEIIENKKPSFSKLAFMIDAGDFISNRKINFSLIDDVINNSTTSPFTICRVAIKYDEIDKGYDIAKYISDKGYELIINLMGISLLDKPQIIKLSLYNKLNPIASYFADSFGALSPEKVSFIVEIFKEFTENVGVHLHDNMGLAFANSLSALNSGATYIDSTLLGMGRGAGNLKTEQIVSYLKHTNEKSNLNNSSIQNFIEKYMKTLLTKYNWGFTINYMISGIKHIHPLYSQVLQTTFLNSNKIQKIILSLKDPLKYDFNEISSQIAPRVAVVIPARYKSKRFPGKPLAKINGEEMIVMVSKIAAKAVGVENVYVATENNEIVSVVKSKGYKVILTSDDCLTGTDRVAEAALEIKADIIINVQGDEPMLDPGDIKKVIQAKINNPDSIINCYAELDRKDLNNINIPKVVTDIKGDLLYSSRSAIPGSKDNKPNNSKKQVCIYGFNKEELMLYSSLGSKSPLEKKEDIEILRFKELGCKVKMIKLNSNTLAVDLPEDIIKVEELINFNKLKK